MEEILKQDDTYKNNRKVFPLKFYQLLPESCKILDTLDTNDRDDDVTNTGGVSIETVASLCIPKKHVQKKRKFVLTIYKIKKESVCQYKITFAFDTYLYISVFCM